MLPERLHLNHWALDGSDVLEPGAEAYVFTFG